MIDPSASPTAPGAPEASSRGWWVGRRLLVSVLFVIAIVLPGFIIALGALFFLLSFFQDAAQSRSDLIAGGVFLAIVGGVFMVPGLIFFLRRRRRGAEKLGEAEDAELALEVIPPGRMPTTLAELDAVFGPPVAPPPTAVMLPFALHSRPWRGRSWWLAPLVFIAAPVWVAIDHHGLRGQILIWTIGSLAIGLLVGALQFAYVYRRRIVVDDLTVSYLNNVRRDYSAAAHRDPTNCAAHDADTDRAGEPHVLSGIQWAELVEGCSVRPNLRRGVRARGGAAGSDRPDLGSANDV